MNTSAGYYRAPRQPRIPLDEVLIKLHPEGFHQEFEADGINVGAGGLSMRASVVPEVGSTLRCQLDNPTGGEAIQMIGRVVWAHESGPHVGEFGIRFTHLGKNDQVRIEALIQRWGRTAARAPIVQLQLEGVGSPIMAEVQSETETGLSVEQPLPFLAIGNALLNQTTGRRGHLEAVELKMDDKTPKLVLSIGYEVAGASEPGTGGESDRDTFPEDMSPLARTESLERPARLQDAPRIVRYDPEVEDGESLGAVETLSAHAKSATKRVAAVAGSARAAVTEDLVPRAKENVKGFFALLARFVAALRARLDDKPRRQQVPRSEAARAHLRNTRRHRGRYLVVAVMAAAIVAAGWGIYLWAAAGSEDSETELAAASAADTELEAEPSPPAEPGVEAAAEPPPEAVVPLGYVDQGAPLPPEAVRGTAFGADAVPGGEKYVLRMSNPVIVMDGIIEDDGFSVTIPGSLSLSRAGPIATVHPDVEHASILNRGDFSELTLRFVAGRHPAYRVEAQGPAIEITIAR